MGKRKMRKSNNTDHPFVVVRMEQNLKQDELADILGVTDKYISFIECGEKPVSRKLAEKLNREFGYRVDWLLGLSQFKNDDEIRQFAHGLEPQPFASALDFEKEWIRSGGGAHILNNPIVVEARIAVALEKMNESGWQVAVDLVESLLKVPAFRSDEKQGGKE